MVLMIKTVKTKNVSLTKEQLSNACNGLSICIEILLERIGDYHRRLNNFDKESREEFTFTCLISRLKREVDYLEEVSSSFEVLSSIRRSNADTKVSEVK